MYEREAAVHAHSAVVHQRAAEMQRQHAVDEKALAEREAGRE